MATLPMPAIAPPTIAAPDSDSEQDSEDDFSDAVQALDVGVSGSGASSSASMPAPSIRAPSVSLPPTIAQPAASHTDAVEDDAPPAFPALNSAQRAGAGSSSANSSAAAALSSSKPAPPSSKASSLRSVLGVPSRPMQSGGLSAGSGLMVPPSTSALTAPPGVGGASGARSGAGTGGLGVPAAASSKRKKVVLEPGCSPLDWARLKSSTDLRGGITTLQRIPPSELARHKTEDDAWSAFNGKVYNLTPYLRFHPGGVKEVMRVAGRDGTRLFMLTHSWVNIDAMIDSAMVGMLVPEPSGG